MAGQFIEKRAQFGHGLDREGIGSGVLAIETEPAQTIAGTVQPPVSQRRCR